MEYQGHPRFEGGGRALLVEDNLVIRLVETAVLAKLGLSVDIAANGVEAARSTRYDIIFMDCVMPVMDGYEATARIRRLEGSTRHTPIVMVTSAAMTGDLEKYTTSGLDGWVTKPFDPAALSDMVAEVCSGGPRSTPPASGPNPADGGTGAPALQSDADRQEHSRLFDLFLDSTPKLLADLTNAALRQNLPGARYVAHSLNGAAVSLGATRLGELADDILRLDLQQSDQLEPLVQELDREVAVVRRRLSPTHTGT